MARTPASDPLWGLGQWRRIAERTTTSTASLGIERFDESRVYAHRDCCGLCMLVRCNAACAVMNVNIFVEHGASVQ